MYQSNYIMSNQAGTSYLAVAGSKTKAAIASISIYTTTHNLLPLGVGKTSEISAILLSGKSVSDKGIKNVNHKKKFSLLFQVFCTIHTICIKTLNNKNKHLSKQIT